MAEENQKSGKSQKKYIILTASVAAILILLVVFYPSDMRISADKQLEAIEAARFVPDEENAATIYKQLFADFNENDFNSTITGVDVSSSVFSRPWKSEDYPLASRWLQGQEKTIAKLLEAAKKEKCYFPIEIESSPYDPNSHMERFHIFMRWAQLYVFVANNDTGEGRFDEAVEKYKGMLRLAEHINQQPQITPFLVSISIESLALAHMKTVIIEGNITEEQLTLLEEIPLETTNEWNKLYPEMRKIEKLVTKKMRSKLPLPTRISMFFYEKFVFPSVPENVYDIYLRAIIQRRGHKILIALRRYKNRNGKWPDKLEQIKDLVEPDVLIDPFSEGNFIYQLTKDHFTLYSTGLNKIDEGGNYNYTFGRKKQEPDDWLIWPKR